MKAVSPTCKPVGFPAKKFMTKDFTVQIADQTIPVTVIRRKGRTISIRVEDDGNISVRAPYQTGNNEIISFISSKQEWILRQREVQNRRSLSVRDGSDGKNAVWMGKTCRVITKISLIPHIEFDGDTMIFHVPSDSSEERTALFYQEAAKQVASWVVGERKHLDDDICIGCGKPIPRITVRYMTSRWGSCSAGKARISISSRLIHFPKQCFDYVLLHEYAHLLVQNHSADFYREIEKRMPDYKVYDRMIS